MVHSSEAKIVIVSVVLCCPFTSASTTLIGKDAVADTSHYLHFLSIGMMFEQEYMDLLNVALISIVSIVKKKRTDV